MDSATGAGRRWEGVAGWPVSQETSSDHKAD
jgi:hypothetical protein